MYAPFFVVVLTVSYQLHVNNYHGFLFIKTNPLVQESFVTD